MSPQQLWLPLPFPMPWCWPCEPCPALLSIPSIRLKNVLLTGLPVSPGALNWNTATTESQQFGVWTTKLPKGARGNPGEVLYNVAVASLLQDDLSMRMYLQRAFLVASPCFWKRSHSSANLPPVEQQRAVLLPSALLGSVGWMTLCFLRVKFCLSLH